MFGRFAKGYSGVRVSGTTKAWTDEAMANTALLMSEASAAQSAAYGIRCSLILAVLLCIAFRIPFLVELVELKALTQTLKLPKP